MNERDRQDGLVSEIYKDCDFVVVWLGTYTIKFREGADDFNRRPPDLRAILRDECFTRLWVVQEVFLARKVRLVCRCMTGIVDLSWS